MTFIIDFKTEMIIWLIGSRSFQYLGEEVVVERRPEAADVKLTRRARSEPHSHLVLREVARLLLIGIQ